MTDRRTKVARAVGVEISIPAALFLVTGAWAVALAAVIVGGYFLVTR